MSIIEVATAKEMKLIPESYHSIFYDDCEICGKPMGITDNLTVYSCTNTRCYLRIAGQMSAMLSDLKCKGWAGAKCLEYVRYNQFMSIIEVILGPPADFRGLKELIQAQGLNYPQLIQLLHIPKLGTRLIPLLKGINSYKELLNEIESVGSVYEFCRLRLGGEDMPAEIANIIETYAAEFEFVEELIVPVKQVSKQVSIVITGEISGVTDKVTGKSLTKKDFVKALNDLTRDSDIEFVMTTALQSCIFIVADSEDNTAKYRVGLARGNLITSHKLYSVALSYKEESDKAKELASIDKTSLFDKD